MLNLMRFHTANIELVGGLGAREGKMLGSIIAVVVPCRAEEFMAALRAWVRKIR